jgi:hypothetical protein
MRLSINGKNNNRKNGINTSDIITESEKEDMWSF